MTTRGIFSTNCVTDAFSCAWRKASRTGRESRCQPTSTDNATRTRVSAIARGAGAATRVENCDPDRSRAHGLRGSPKATVVIVEFSDFQCPFCRQVQPTLKNLLAKYEGRVSLAYRDFPLREIHPQAQSAAEAARCAGEQGQFWPYHDLLFAHPEKLNREGLVEHARSLKLDEKQFDSCLSSGKFKAQIEEDLQQGLRAGVNGTPGFFINGISLSGAQPQAIFDRFIQIELAIPGSRNMP